MNENIITIYDEKHKMEVEFVFVGDKDSYKNEKRLIELLTEEYLSKINLR